MYGFCRIYGLGCKRLKIKALCLFLVAAMLISVSAYADIYGAINKNQVNIREEASAKSDIIFRLDKGDEIKILDYDDDWCHIYYEPTKKSGYVMTEFVDADISTEKVELADYNPDNQSKYEDSLFNFISRYNAAVEISQKNRIVDKTETLMLYDFSYDNTVASAECITDNLVIHVDFGERGQLIGFRLNIPSEISEFSTSVKYDSFGHSRSF